MLITAAALERATRTPYRLAVKFVSAINVAAERYCIDSAPRLAAFLAQIAHESGRFARLVENLNYSASGLANTWPLRYADMTGGPNALALSLSGRPAAIANNAYANRMGNGDEASGDGWRYRGRGLIQITGRDNYYRCGEALDLDLINRPETLEAPLYAALSAGWFWDRNDLNALADRGRLRAITRAINGGEHGLADRLSLYESALSELGGL